MGGKDEFLQWFSNKFDRAKEIIGELEDMVIEIAQIKTHKALEKRRKEHVKDVGQT